MKIFVAFVATAAAIDCPVGWFDDDGMCAPDEVTVDCSNTHQMVVTFPVSAIYNVDDAIDLSLTFSEAQLSLTNAVVDADVDGCHTFVYDGETGLFSATIGLTDCGTTAAHVDDNIEFSAVFTGDEAALMRDGIITTKVHTFTAKCSYADSATIFIDDLGVTMTTIDGGSNADGSYSFDLASFSDEALVADIDYDNKVEIGSKIYNTISPSSGVVIPSNVNFYVTDCIAYENMTAYLEGDNSYGSYSFINGDDCSSLVDVGIEQATGADENDIVFSFNSFTFNAASDTLGIECGVKLCLADGTDSSCAALGATCGE